MATCRSKPMTTHNKQQARLRKLSALEIAQRIHAGQSHERQPPTQVAARKRIEDINLAREIGVPVEEIL